MKYKKKKIIRMSLGILLGILSRSFYYCKTDFQLQLNQCRLCMQYKFNKKFKRATSSTTSLATAVEL